MNLDELDIFEIFLIDSFHLEKFNVYEDTTLIFQGEKKIREYSLWDLS